MMRSIMRIGLAALLLLGAVTARAGAEQAVETKINLSALGAANMSAGWNKSMKNKSAGYAPLKIGGRSFQHGIGTHAASAMRIDLHGAALRFTAHVGIDDEVGTRGSVVFSAWADGAELWSSGVMKGGEPAKAVELELAGKQVLVLLVGNAGDGIDFDHADWAEAEIVYSGAAPSADTLPEETPVILTPPAPAEPRINGAKVFGVRPGSPMLYTIAATGERPMRFAADGLPQGLSFDNETGRITGKLDQPGEYAVKLGVENARGKAQRVLRIIVGERIALTPPMGWNSWNCWGFQVSQEKVMASARAMVDTGLVNHGWSSVNIDDGWQAARGGEFNAIQPNKKFPDMGKLAGDIHAMGLRLGIYSTPWRGSYAGFIGSYSDNADGSYDWIKDGRVDEFFQLPTPAENYTHGNHSFVPNDVRQWAAWGIDYLKYDWYPNDVEHVGEMSKALRACGRDITYSLSNTAPFEHAAAWAEWANCWRTTGDITDTWASVQEIGFNQEKWAPYAAPGHWNDPDMLVVGHVGWGSPHPSKLTPNEQYTHISLWCLLAAPLLIGCDMAQLDDFTLSLLTNDEVLAVDQDALGIQGRRVKQDTFTQVWAKPLEDGSIAVGLFNLGEWELPVRVTWDELKLDGKRVVRDLWRQQDIGEFNGAFETAVPRHGVVLLRLAQ